MEPYSTGVYEVDPLTCPKCQGRMKVIGFIEDQEVIKKILKHLGLWDLKARPPKRTNAPPINTHLDYSARPGATDSYYRNMSCA